MCDGGWLQAREAFAAWKEEVAVNKAIQLLREKKKERDTAQLDGGPWPKKRPCSGVIWLHVCFSCFHVMFFFSCTHHNQDCRLVEVAAIMRM